MNQKIESLLNSDYKVKCESNLVMYGYTDRRFMNEETNLLNNIICDENKKILHYSGKFIQEKLYSDVSNEGITEVYKFPEGTFLRLFYRDERWQVATNRCLDASKARFSSSMSFAELLDDIVDEDFYNSFDKNFCYCCVVKHTASRIVLPVDRNEVAIVSKTNLSSLENVLNKDYLIPCGDISDLVRLHDSLIIKEGGEYFRVFSDKYLRVRELKKMHVNNPVTRMIDLLTKEQEDIPEYAAEFPEQSDVYDFTVRNLENFTKKVYRDYINLKVKKKKLHFEKLYYMLLCRIHGEFLTTGVKTDLSIVQRAIYKTDTKTLRLLMFSEFHDAREQELYKQC